MAYLDRLALVNDLVERLLADIALDLPGREDMALCEDLLDLLERASSSLREHEEEVDSSSKVESAEDEVRLVSDRRKTGRNSPREREVEHPVRGGRDRHGLGANLHREDLGGVCPRDGTERDGERADGEVRAHDDTLGRRIVAVDEPDLGVVELAPVAEATLETTDEHQEEAHGDCAGDDHRATTPFVDEEDSGD